MSDSDTELERRLRHRASVFAPDDASLLLQAADALAAAEREFQDEERYEALPDFDITHPGDAAMLGKSADKLRALLSPTDET